MNRCIDSSLSQLNHVTLRTPIPTQQGARTYRSHACRRRYVFMYVNNLQTLHPPLLSSLLSFASLLIAAEMTPHQQSIAPDSVRPSKRQRCETWDASVATHFCWDDQGNRVNASTCLDPYGNVWSGTQYIGSHQGGRHQPGRHTVSPPQRPSLPAPATARQYKPLRQPHAQYPRPQPGPSRLPQQSGSRPFTSPFRGSRNPFQQRKPSSPKQHESTYPKGTAFDSSPAQFTFQAPPPLPVAKSFTGITQTAKLDNSARKGPSLTRNPSAYGGLGSQVEKHHTSQSDSTHGPQAHKSQISSVQKGNNTFLASSDHTRVSAPSSDSTARGKQPFPSPRDAAANPPEPNIKEMAVRLYQTLQNGTGDPWFLAFLESMRDEIEDELPQPDGGPSKAELEEAEEDREQEQLERELAVLKEDVHRTREAYRSFIEDLPESERRFYTRSESMLCSGA